jgi:hypothetical protein
MPSQAVRFLRAMCGLQKYTRSDRIVWSAASSRRCQPSSGLASPVRADRKTEVGIKNYSVCRICTPTFVLGTYVG